MRPALWKPLLVLSSRHFLKISFYIHRITWIICTCSSKLSLLYQFIGNIFSLLLFKFQSFFENCQFNPNQGGGGGLYGTPYHMFAYIAKVLLFNIFRVFRLFLTIIYDNFKIKIKVFHYWKCFYGHFCLGDPGFYIMKRCRDNFNS